MMARFIIQSRVETPDGLKAFQDDGYGFIESLSDDTNYVFLRDRESGEV